MTAAICATFAICALWLFSPGPNEIFLWAKNRAMKQFAKHLLKWWRFVFQVVFCPWCSALVIAIILTVIFPADFWVIFATAEATATLTIFAR